MYQDMLTDANSNQYNASTFKFIIVAYCMLCLLSYGIGALFLSLFPSNAISGIVTIFSGLLIVATCPGLVLSFTLFGNRHTFTEHVVIGFGLNLLILPALVVLIHLAGIPVSTHLVLGAIALLTFFAAAAWLRLDGPCPSLSEAKTTLSRLVSSALCLLAIVFALPREVLAPIDRYSSDDSRTEIVTHLASYKERQSVSEESIARHRSNVDGQLAAPNLTWTYTNAAAQPRRFVLSLLTNCGELQILPPPSGQAASQSPAERTLGLGEVLVSSSKYLPVSKVGKEFLDAEFPDRNRVYVSEPFDLLPGENRIDIHCSDNKGELRIVDLSVMDKPQLFTLLSQNYLFKAEPEVGDAQEAFLEGKYALDKISWINPPLLYPVYRSVFEILGLKISSIALFELFAFSLVFILLCLIVTEGQAILPVGYLAVPLIVVVNYAVAVTMLPVLHSAAGVFLLVFLASTWFLWKRQFIPAVGACILMCLIRYEGIVLAALSLFAFVALADEQIRIRFRNSVLLAFAIVGIASLVLVWVWGPEMFQTGAVVERIYMLSPTSFGPRRFIDYTQWALVLASGIPFFWIFIKRTDRLSAYYMLIAVSYLGFLWSLNYLRPYHYGPIVFAAAAAGGRAILGVHDAAIRRMAMTTFFVVAFASSYLIAYHLPRQVQWPPSAYSAAATLAFAKKQ
jgi:hypothetical protein